MADASREEIGRLVAAGDAASARLALGELWRAGPGPAAAGFVVSQFEKLRPRMSLTSCRLAILRSFTVEPVVPLLQAMAFLHGLDLEVRLGDFNTWTQDALDAAGWLYDYRPDAVLLAVQLRDAAPTLWDGFADLAGPAVSEASEQLLATFGQVVRTFRAHSAAPLVVHSLEQPSRPAWGLLDGRVEWGQSAAIERVNAGLSNLARESRHVYLLDYNALVARRGRVAWSDARKWITSRQPVAAPELIHLAEEWLRFLLPITGRVCKALAVDLDNTLWGGVIGEDAMQGIKLGDAWPGAAFRALQRAILDLYRRGIILAVCSKNNSAEAMEAIEKHPGMLLRPEHFAAIRTNWADKAANLREIAAELNIGLDAVAFLDDNPVERQWVRGQTPEVTVIELPPGPEGYADALRESPVFERLELTEEDKARGRYYAEQRMRTELEAGASSLEGFYRSLQMAARIERVTEATLPRAAQLTQKTNQFNLTTRRYGEAELAATLAAPGWEAWTLQVSDRFGDNGIVGLVITRQDDGVREIDTLLLSCRVIGRTVETALLSAAAERAAAAGASRLAGWFNPTRKNAPAKDFYSRHGFALVEERNGATRWELALAPMSVKCPPWIDLRTGPDGAGAASLVHAREPAP